VRSHHAPWIVSNGSGSSASAMCRTRLGGNGIMFGYEYMNVT